MQCLYCGKPLNLLRELTDSEFCSRDHQQRYKRLTARAFTRLMEAQPAPSPRLPPQHLTFRHLPVPEAASAAPRRYGPEGPCTGFVSGLAAPEMARAPTRLEPAHAGHLILSGPEPAPPAVFGLAGVQPVEFPSHIVRCPVKQLQLATEDGPLDALKHFPDLAPGVVEELLREAGGAFSHAGEVVARTPSPRVCLPPVMAAPVNGSSLAAASFRLTAPSLLPMPPKMAGAPAPLPPAARRGVPLPGAAGICEPRPADLLPARMPEALAPAPAIAALEPLPLIQAPQLRLIEHDVEPDMIPMLAPGAIAEEVPVIDLAVQPGESPSGPGLVPAPATEGFGPLNVVAPEPAGLLPLRMPAAARIAPALSAVEPLPCLQTPLVRRLQLDLAPDCLALKIRGIVAEEVFGADVVERPAGAAVYPRSMASGSVLPALASLFRYGRLARQDVPLPHMTEGVVPRNRTAQPAAYRELPMPVLNPVVPRSSGLRIVETFEYLRPMEAPAFGLLQRLVQLWTTAPVYLRYAAVSACMILLFWAYVPQGGIAQLAASRWSRIEESIGRRAAVELTEDFQGGMETWEGKGDWSRTWQISKAGYVRPGKLALYQPSMHMREYHVEFLMQVEKKAVSWAYRATDQENYYASKITIVKPGPLPVLSLVRYPVIGGREGPRVEIPIRVLMHNNTPYRVQLNVNSGGFSTLIEGQLVDFWRDDSLKVGGFGFFSDTGESARIYWMKLNHQDDFIGRVCAYFNPAPVNRRRVYRPL